MDNACDNTHHHCKQHYLQQRSNRIKQQQNIKQTKQNKNEKNNKQIKLNFELQLILHGTVANVNKIFPPIVTPETFKNYSEDMERNENQSKLNRANLNLAIVVELK